MKLYLISQTANSDYDTYDSAVVVAEHADAARLINPATGKSKFPPLMSHSHWVRRVYDVTAVYLGEADEAIEEACDEYPVICSSFNAG